MTRQGSTLVAQEGLPGGGDGANCSQVKNPTQLYTQLLNAQCATNSAVGRALRNLYDVYRRGHLRDQRDTLKEGSCMAAELQAPFVGANPERQAAAVYGHHARAPSGGRSAGLQDFQREGGPVRQGGAEAGPERAPAGAWGCLQGLSSIGRQVCKTL